MWTRFTKPSAGSSSSRFSDDLAESPERGSCCSDNLPTTRYLVAYRIRDEVVQILAVMHGTQRWPRRFRAK
ncbi:MAG: type II toxin-antitoxin system RelE/ParE family toxin [Silvibacterium sp.]|nr:type II toxin-antitoxin system RelE/ParE family toxin [Silvibacterium sp.]